MNWLIAIKCVTLCRFLAYRIEWRITHRMGVFNTFFVFDLLTTLFILLQYNHKGYTLGKINNEQHPR